MSSKPTWTPEQDKVLSDLWGTKMTCTEIAKAMGLKTKNMVIGRAHRLQLPKRASPIKKEKAIAAPKKPKAIKPPITPSIHPSPPKPKPEISQKPVIEAPVEVPVDAPVIIIPARDKRACRFPMWKDKERPTHQYCDEPLFGDGAYCAKHTEVCYVKTYAQMRKEAA